MALVRIENAHFRADEIRPKGLSELQVLMATVRAYFLFDEKYREGVIKRKCSDIFNNDDGFLGSVLNGLEQIDHKKLEEEVRELPHMCEEKEASSDAVEKAKYIHEIINELLKASPVEFSQLFFDAIDEKDMEEFCKTGSRYPLWMAAVARAKLEGVVPLKGSGSRVMAEIPHRGITIEACKGDCVFHQDASNRNDLEYDVCSHPNAPPYLEMPDTDEPPERCPLRTNTFHIALDTKYFNGTGEDGDEH